MNAGVITNVLRTALMIIGTWLVTKHGANQEQVNAAVDAALQILGVVIASGGAIWSLIRSIKRAKAGIK